MKELRQLPDFQRFDQTLFIVFSGSCQMVSEKYYNTKYIKLFSIHQDLHITLQKTLECIMKLK